MPGGRPLELDHTLRTRAKDGSPVSVADHLLERITLGVALSDAAASANVSRQTLHSWRRAGANARQRAANGEKLDAKGERLVGFLDALERAEADAEATRLGIIHRAAAGGAEVKKVTRKYQRVKQKDGGYLEVEVERTEHTETLRPEWTAAAWWLERRNPQRYARTVRAELSGPGGGPVQLSTEERAERLAEDLRVYQQGIKDGQSASTPALPAAPEG